MPSKGSRVVAAILLLAFLAVLAFYFFGTPRRHPKIVQVHRVNPSFYQGLAREKGLWFFSDRDAIYKVRGFNVVVAALKPAIPGYLAEKGYDHIGDIDAAGGVIYAPLEDRWYTAPLLAMYSAEDLRFIGVVGPLPQSHMPWVAVDLKKGVFYSSEFDNVDRIYVYSLNGSKLGEIKLSMVLQRIQGGAVRGDKLYLSTDDGGDWVYVVDLSTGKVSRLVKFESPYEGEGIELWEEQLYFLVGTPREQENILVVIELGED